jgi:hypothetical protein
LQPMMNPFSVGQDRLKPFRKYSDLKSDGTIA